MHMANIPKPKFDYNQAVVIQGVSVSHYGVIIGRYFVVRQDLLDTRTGKVILEDVYGWYYIIQFNANHVMYHIAEESVQCII